jgi:hypothetical protein
MKAAPFVVVAVAAAISLAAQPKPEAPFVNVEIVVGSLDAHQDTCKAGKSEASTIFVVNPEQVYHCVGSKLFLHSTTGKEPAMGKTIVRVRAGQRVRWSCKTNRFVVLDVTRHDAGTPGAKPNPAAPERPFTAFAKTPSNTVVSSELKKIDGKTEEHYKATFYVEGVGVVDPDLVCSM